MKVYMEYQAPKEQILENWKSPLIRMLHYIWDDSFSKVKDFRFFKAYHIPVGKFLIKKCPKLKNIMGDPKILNEFDRCDLLHEILHQQGRR